MSIVGKISREIVSKYKANDIILNYPGRSVQRHKVNLHYYHADWTNGVVCNLGDYLSEIVVQSCCDRWQIPIGKTISKTRHLYAIGSILQMGYQNATVWGSGFAFEPSLMRGLLQLGRKLDIRCVRGPKTKETLQRLGFICPEKYGDPAVLLPQIYVPTGMLKTEKYIFIPHFQAEEEARKQYGDDHIVSMNTNDYKRVIDRIVASDRVISSSLHGIVLAEAYGIPAVYYQDKTSRFAYKYEDWYLSTGRSKTNTVHSVEEGMTTRIIQPDKGTIEHMQKTLLDTFPRDIWD